MDEEKENVTVMEEQKSEPENVAPSAPPMSDDEDQGQGQSQSQSQVQGADYGQLGQEVQQLIQVIS